VIGSRALADTVLSSGGDVIADDTQLVFPRLILFEGEYRVIARNKGRTYESQFKVMPGVSAEVEVLAR
jgi:hypothetical protein